MNRTIALLIATFIVASADAQFTGVLTKDIITESPDSGNAFPVVARGGVAAPIWYDTADYAGVVRAVGDLRNDIDSVTGVRPELTGGAPAVGKGVAIVVGTLGKSKKIGQLVKARTLDVKDLRGKWESFVITTAEDPADHGRRLLVIAGSDKRGTIYGIYELSQQLGVSPWYWWADVPARKRAAAYVLPGRYFSGEPKVRYRGIFINDEAPCFSGWSREKFGGPNSKMYTHMFELLLRLHANFLWPAMWGNAFNEDDPDNPRLADEYGIVMGTSHHEPMLRAQKEWGRHRKEFGNGEWNYVTNKQGLQEFWRQGLERNKNYESIITMGMRGDGDKPMPDAGSAQANFRVLEGIMADQRKIISEVTHKPASRTPQLWALYSEVLDYYDQGMKVPDDMIILLCDDNWGDVRRLPGLKGPRHPGGYGMYYHVDLHGAPRSYQWLNMTAIPHMWEQLQLTYSYGVDKVWILNAGDLKPNEYPMDFFLHMAWDPTRFGEHDLDEYARQFCADKFGAGPATEAADILSTYCKYAGRVTAEMLNDRTYNLQTGEFLQVRDAFLALEARALDQYLSLPERYKDTYKELILHPVRAMANLYDLYYAVAMNKKLAAEKDIRANYWADYADSCFARDAAYSRDYNLGIAGGKWDHMMDQTHIGYRSWDEPRHGNVKPAVIRLQAGEATTGGYVFTEKNKVVVMEAEHYFSAVPAPDTHWAVIPGLGRTLSGLALLPYTKPTGSAAVNYRLRLNGQSDSVRVRLVFNSTLPFKKGGQRVSAAFDGGAAVSRNINDQLTWRNNYSKMYPTAAARIIESDITLALPSTPDNIHTLVVRPLDPGVVIEKVIVDDGGYESTFLKMAESPYQKQN
ncbi:MAG TPA: glycosyl hydrolase 115 family protein [Puia sp.]|nr:glycosyl hydrolase 115 family protein [Puia sp.]